MSPNPYQGWSATQTSNYALVLGNLMYIGSGLLKYIGLQAGLSGRDLDAAQLEKEKKDSLYSMMVGAQYTAYSAASMFVINKKSAAFVPQALSQLTGGGNTQAGRWFAGKAQNLIASGVNQNPAIALLKLGVLFSVLKGSAGFIGIGGKLDSAQDDLAKVGYTAREGYENGGLTSATLLGISTLIPAIAAFGETGMNFFHGMFRVFDAPYNHGGIYQWLNKPLGERSSQGLWQTFGASLGKDRLDSKFGKWLVRFTDEGVRDIAQDPKIFGLRLSTAVYDGDRLSYFSSVKTAFSKLCSNSTRILGGASLVNAFINPAQALPSLSAFFYSRLDAKGIDGNNQTSAKEAVNNSQLFKAFRTRSFWQHSILTPIFNFARKNKYAVALSSVFFIGNRLWKQSDLSETQSPAIAELGIVPRGQAATLASQGQGANAEAFKHLQESRDCLDSLKRSPAEKAAQQVIIENTRLESKYTQEHLEIVDQSLSGQLPPDQIKSALQALDARYPQLTNVAPVSALGY